MRIKNYLCKYGKKAKNKNSEKKVKLEPILVYEEIPFLRKRPEDRNRISAIHGINKNMKSKTQKSKEGRGCEQSKDSSQKKAVEKGSVYTLEFINPPES